MRRPASAHRGLSKSKVMNWLQCPKRLWLEVHKPELAETSETSERVFSAGHEVGRVARALRRGGVLVEWRDGDQTKALADTAAHMRAGTRLLFEPAFQHDGVLVRADILERRPSGAYRLHEVKQSAKVKPPEHHCDAAIQAWVLRGAGVKVESVLIQHVDTDFVYPGGGDYRGLFSRQAVDDDIRPHLKEVPKWIEGARSTLEGRQPRRQTGKHCGEPYDCPFHDHCSSREPPEAKYPISILPGIREPRLEALASEGYRDVRQIPAGVLTNPAHERVRRITKAGRPELLPAARKAVAALGWPRYYFDFETVGFAVPIWPRTRPHIQVPFQWSCHIEHRSGRLEHRSFIDVTGNPPMQPLVEAMLEALGDSGPILAHWAPFEMGRIKELARILPRHAKALKRLLPRFIDTHPLVEKYYYHPAMRGSWGLKSILPTVAPDLDYDDLDIQDGGQASTAYLEITAPDTLPERKRELRAALERYCARDTLGLVRIVRFLAGAK